MGENLGIIYDPITGLFFNLRGQQVGSYTRKYGRICIKGKEYKLSRLAVFLKTGKQLEDNEEVDHINGNTHDNRWINLRVCTRKDNAKNRRRYKNNKSGYKGVHQAKYKDKIYHYARIQVDNRSIFLGSFPSAKEAAKAYDDAARKYHKEFSALNFGE